MVKKSNKVEVEKEKNKKGSITEEKHINTEANNASSVETEEKSETEVDVIEETEIKAEEKLPDFKQKYNELNDKYLRLSAEYDNFRKRSLKEKMEMIKTAGQDILISILPVIDNFERALKSINTDNTEESKAIREGIDLIYNNFKDFLSQRGVKEIDALGKSFDTDHHEAITKIPAPQEELKGKVIDVIEKGYLMHDKVIRFSKVVVGE
jgi:molecular chaperone GrpE